MLNWYLLGSQISDVVSDLGIYVLYQQPESWQELLPFMFQCVQSQNPRLMEGSLNMFAQVRAHATCHSIQLTSQWTGHPQSHALPHRVCVIPSVGGHADALIL
jgi:hypothetical protein